MVDVSPVILTVTFFAFILGFGILVADLLKKRRLPDSFFLLLLGLVLGPTFFAHPAVTQYVDIALVDVSQMGILPDFLRILALILIVFTGMFNVSLTAFRRFSDTSLNLAFIGPIVTAIILGITANAIFGLDWIFAFLLGAIISGSSAAVLRAFEATLSKSKKAYTILNLESILNGPVSVLLPILILDLILLDQGALIEPLKYASEFWLLIAAGAGTGLITGFGAVRFISRMRKEYSALLLFAIALIAFALAENIGGSGLLAVAIAGLIIGNTAFKDKKEVKRFDDYFSEMLRISVFVLLGAQVMLFITLEQFVATLLFLVVVLLARLVFLVPLLWRRRQEFTATDLILLAFVAPKGLEAAATAPIVVAAVARLGGGIGGDSVYAGIANEMINIIFLITLLTILVSTVVARLISNRLAQEKQKINRAQEKSKDRMFAPPEAAMEKQKGEATAPLLAGAEKAQERKIEKPGQRPARGKR